MDQEVKFGDNQDAPETPAVVETPKTPETPQLSEVEVRAMEQGWKPLDQWDGDPSEHRSAKEFIDRGELLAKIKSQGAELRSVKEQISHLSEHNRKVFAAGYEKAVIDLKQQKKTALEEGDFDKVVEIDEQIADNKAAAAALKQAPKVDQPPQSVLYQDWVRSNDWYLKDTALKHWANAMAIEYAQKTGNVDEAEIYSYLSREVRKTFPSKFPQRQAAPSPDTSGRTASQKPTTSGDSFEKLISTFDEQSQKVARNLVKSGHITKEKYVEDYEKFGER